MNRYYQPSYTLTEGCYEYFAPNIYETKEGAWLYLSELEKALGIRLYDKHVRDLFVDCYTIKGD